MNEKLRQDVELLRSKRIIRRDRDIIDLTGVNKTALSNYLSGKVKASKPFLEKFYEVYKNELGVNKVNITPPTIEKSDLEKENARLYEIIAIKDKIIDAQKSALIMAERYINSITKKVAHATSPSKNKN